MRHLLTFCATCCVLGIVWLIASFIRLDTQVLTWFLSMAITRFLLLLIVVFTYSICHYVSRPVTRQLLGDKAWMRQSQYVLWNRVADKDWVNVYENSDGIITIVSGNN